MAAEEWTTDGPVDSQSLNAWQRVALVALAGAAIIIAILAGAALLGLAFRAFLWGMGR